MLRTRVIVVVALLVVPLLVFVGMVASGPHGCGMSIFAVRVRGRLLEARSLEPIRRARLMSFPYKSWSSDASMIQHADDDRRRLDDEARRRREANEEPLPASVQASQLAIATTAEGGGFELLVKIWDCRSGPTPDRIGIECLSVERESRARVLVDVRGGEWRWGASGDEIGATWDLGDVLVEPASR